MFPEALQVVYIFCFLPFYPYNEPTARDQGNRPSITLLNNLLLVSAVTNNDIHQLPYKVLTCRPFIVQLLVIHLIVLMDDFLPVVGMLFTLSEIVLSCRHPVCTGRDDLLADHF